MITLFSGTGNSEKSALRDAYLERLQEISDEGYGILWPFTDEAQSVLDSGGHKARPFPNGSAGEDGTMNSATQVSLESAEDASFETLTFERQTQEIASKFAEAFVFAFRKMGFEQGQTQALRMALLQISERVDRLSAEVALKPEELDSVVSQLALLGENLSEHRNLDAARDERLRQLEQSANQQHEAVRQQMAEVSAGVRQANERCETLAKTVEEQTRATAETSEISRMLQEEQQTLHKRLDVHAQAIRSVHSVAEERDDRLKGFLAALEKAKEVYASRVAAAPLPDAL